MKAKKTYLVLPILTLLGAAGSFLLRKGQIAHAFEPTGLLTAGSGYTYALAAVWVVMALAAVGLSWKAGKGLTNSIRAGLLPGGYTPYFHQNFPMACVTALGGALVACGGGLAMARWARRVLWEKLDLIWGGAMLVTGLCLIYGAFRRNWGEKGPGTFAWELLPGGVGMCLWLIRIYQCHTANPCVWEYMPALLGAIAGAVGCLAVASFSFEKPRPRLAVACGTLGTALLSGYCADLLYFTADPFRAAEGLTAAYLLAAAGFALYLWSMLATLCYRLRTPAEIVLPEPESEPESERENHQDTL